MSYLVALPCMFAVYFHARRLDLPGVYSATVLLLLTVILAASGWIIPGADALVALSITMGSLNTVNWYIEEEFERAIYEGSVVVPAPARTTPFCATSSHDFAIAPRQSDYVVEKINSEDWSAVKRILSGFSAAQRQGFYANLDYGSIDTNAALNFIKQCPDHSDAHILYGHVELCSAKGLGLVPGVVPDEQTAVAVANAFKHFRLALRLNADDVEAMCGLILAKGFIALNNEHIESTLIKLLNIDSGHFHGLISAARFLIKEPENANHFVSLVENVVSDSDVSLAFVRVLAHVECASLHDTGLETDSSVRADLYAQLKVYERDCESLGSWQRSIAGNVIAYAFDMIGDEDEKKRQLAELNGVFSPYPWRRKRSGDQIVTSVI